MTKRRNRNVTQTTPQPKAFTLIELLVVISIIALLVGILLPALGAARKSAQAIVCGGNERNVGQAVTTYTTDGKGLFPPSYVYPMDDKGDWRWEDQYQGNTGNPVHYLHWSYIVYGKQTGGDDAFTCPAMENGGMPRTFPGDDRENWQISPFYPPDLQATRMAYAGNILLMPRNKFFGGVRQFQLVQSGMVRDLSNTILAAEYSANTHMIRNSSGLSKSHRPFVPVKDVGGGVNLISTAPSGNRGRYFYDQNPRASETFGLVDYDTILGEQTGALSQIDSGGPNMNAVGRHHPGGGGGSGPGSEGSGNFVFADGHVERTTVRDTLENRKWGDRVYSVVGNDTAVYDYNE